MYQAIFYDHQTYSYYLRDDVSKWSNFKYQPTYYKRVPNEVEGALPVLTGGWAVQTQKYVKDDPNLLERDIDKELVLLRDCYFNAKEDTIPTYQNIVFIDIEIEMGGALTPEYVKAAPMPLTSISLTDQTTKTKICLIVDSDGEIKTDETIISCTSEKDLILKFLNYWEEFDPTICVTYNGCYFDIPYLYFRICNVFDREVAKRLSPIRKVVVREWMPDDIVRIGGINHLDYMLLFKKYITKEEPSYKLGDIGEKYVGLGKIEYEGNLNQLYKNDKNKFIDYNMRDVEIMEKLEEKFKFIVLTIMISHICNISYEQIYYNTAMNEGAILKYLKIKGIVSPNKPTTHNISLKGSEVSYAGGYLLEPITGLYFDVIDLDFTSLYPSIIKSLNLGIETLVGRIKVKENPTYEQYQSLDKLKQRDPNEVIQIEKLDKIKYTLSSTTITVGKLIEIRYTFIFV